MTTRVRLLLLALVAVIFSVTAAAAPVPPAAAGAGWRSRPAETPVAYTIEATLATIPGEEHPRLLQGKQKIVWTNTSPEPVDVLYLHLYANAFRNTRSSFLREFLKDGGELPDDMVWGACTIQRMDLLDGKRLTPEFVAPDDGNADDRTVVRVPLPRPVDPRGQLVVRMEFTTELPRAFRRTGAWKDYVFAAQWYPKLGRCLRGSKTPNLREGWYCHQYHAGPEFCADFADYDVTLTLPEGWVSGATGTLATDPAGASGQSSAAPPGMRRERYVAEHVVDFAWTASRRFVELRRTMSFGKGDLPEDDVIARERRELQVRLGLTDEDTELPPVEVVLLLQPEHAAQAARHFEAVRVTLGLYGLWFGPYPYGRITVVDPAWGAGGTGGMEYPMLVTAGTVVDSPEWSQRPEQVTVHEVGHQWFMNLLASNESEEAWLDEGLNTYFTARVMDLRYGPPAAGTTVLSHHFPTQLPYEFPGLSQRWPGDHGWPGWAQPPKLEALRLARDLPLLLGTTAKRYRNDPMLPARRSYLAGHGWDEMVCAGWRYVSPQSYRTNAYPRPVLFLNTLHRTARAKFGDLDGDLRMLRAYREYARTHRFSHPGGEDLLRAVREHAGFDATPLWDALARSSGPLDYAIAKVRDVSDPEWKGARDGTSPQDGSSDGRDAPSPPAAGAAPKRTEVLVQRRGEVVVPQTLHVVLRGADGKRTEETRTFDGAARWNSFTFEGEVVLARIDPSRIFLQDARLSDNARMETSTARPGVKWGAQILLWLEHALTTYGQLL